MLTIQRTTQHLQRLAARAESRSAPDDELLAGFAQDRDEAAFAELVRRHGALVYGVARRRLGDHHAAEDVTQAAFLLLARKAPVGGWRATVAPWLYAAAVRLAKKAAARRPPAPLPAAERAAEADPAQPLLWDEVRAALDEELARLPARLRDPLVLCYLQGHTRDEAADSLGWSLATLKRRLDHGRKLLHARLTRRGIALSVLGTAVLADVGELSADVVRRIAGEIATGIVPAAVAALARNSTPALLLKTLVAVSLLAVFGIGVDRMLKKQPAPAPFTLGPERPAQASIDVSGDPLPEGAVTRLGTTRLRPGRSIHSTAFSPDGKQLAIWGQAWSAAGPDRMIFADPATGRELRSLTLPRNWPFAMRWLADGRGLAFSRIGKDDFFLWQFTDASPALPDNPNADLNSGGDGMIDASAISPDGRWLATGRVSW